MREFAGKVAVVTGAGSGIGRGLAERFAREGMKIVLADVEKDTLVRTAAELHARGTEVLSVEVDVSRRESVEALCRQAIARFGRVHVLCNNAGVSGGGSPLWATSVNDWQWVVGVNLMGIVHGIQAFIPGMLAHGEDGYVINTSSENGLATGAGSIYSVTKHAVTQLTEGLYYDLRAVRARIGVSLLCPGLVATRIIEADRNRPSALRNPGARSAAQIEQRQALIEYWESHGMAPEAVAEVTLDAVKQERFYILTHSTSKAKAEARMRAILEDRAPPPLDSF